MMKSKKLNRNKEAQKNKLLIGVMNKVGRKGGKQKHRNKSITSKSWNGKI